MEKHLQFWTVLVLDLNYNLSLVYSRLYYLFIRFICFTRMKQNFDVFISSLISYVCEVVKDHYLQ